MPEEAARGVEPDHGRAEIEIERLSGWSDAESRKGGGGSGGVLQADGGFEGFAREDDAALAARAFINGAGHASQRADIRRPAQVDAEDFLESGGREAVVALHHEKFRVAQRRYFTRHYFVIRVRVFEHVKVLAHCSSCEGVGDDTHRCDLGRVGDEQAHRVEVVGLFERALQHPDKHSAIRREGETFHTAIAAAFGQFHRQRAVERREALEFLAGRVEMDDERAVFIADPERAVGHGHKPFGIEAVHVSR